MNTEKIVLKNLLRNEEYTRKVLPFLKSEYFIADTDKVLFQTIQEFILKYNTQPTKDALQIEIDKNKTLTEDTVKKIYDDLQQMNKDAEDTNIDWLVSTTEQFCQDKGIYNAIMKSIEIMNSPKGSLSKGSIPQLLSDALAISFDPNIGHDYFDNIEERYEYYHRVQEKIPFDLEFFNKITKNGLPKKTLNIALAGTGVGKSLFMCHCAASALSQGKNVLYITLEMAEEKIAERIDANLLNVNIKDIGALPEAIFTSRINEIGKKTQGKLIIKEYPTASAHAGHFKSLLNELSLKKYFKPDIIFIDYLNICSSARYKGHIVNSYTYVKAIAEELRGLAVEHNVPVVSATQTTRSGFGNSDVDLTDTSESFGLPATADFMFALIATEELEQSGRIMVKQLKNRYNDPTMHKRFTVGVDRAKMKLYNVDDTEGSIVDEEESSKAIENISPSSKANLNFSSFVF